MRDFIAFVRSSLGAVMHGSSAYYRWLAFLGVWMLLGCAAAAWQFANGLGVSNLTDQVPWGVYIANFSFLVGLAAASVLVVIPAYVYRDAALYDVSILGELLAVAAMVMSLLFIVVDLGHPELFWHLLPMLGILNFPQSMLAWDVVVINGYLFINAYVVAYLLFSKYRGRVPDKRWYFPVLLLGVVWAVGIHTIPAFLYASLGGRPFWHSAVLAPRFLASAFVSGPSLLIIALTVVRDQMHFPVREEALNRLRQIVGVAAVFNLFLTVSEIFVEIYPGTSHSASMRYILVGLHGHNLLVPYIWTGIALSVFAAVVFLARPLYSRPKLLLVACAAAVIGVWIEKGMGLVIPGFIPTSLGEIVEYSPSFIEFCVSAGIWAIGAFLYTLMLKVAVPIELGTLRRPGAPNERIGLDPVRGAA